MTLNELANIVCEKIPEDWSIVISLNNDAGIVELFDWAGNKIEDACDITITIDEQVKQALAAAISENEE